MIQIRWTESALTDLEQISDYLWEHLPNVAQRTIQQIYDETQSLRRLAHRGRPGRRDGTRELVLAPLPYIVVYRIQDETVEVLHIRHGARRP